MKLGLAVVCVMLLQACEGGASEEPNASETITVSATSVPTAMALTEPDSNSALAVVGRLWFRACVSVLVESFEQEEAVTIVKEALEDAAENGPWTPGFGQPTVDAGCPLPPAALGSNSAACRAEVSPYMAYVFVGSEALFQEAFPEERLPFSFPVPGIRRQSQEFLNKDTRECAVQVAEGWYVTPDELQDEALMNSYISGIWPIASVCC